MKIVSPFIVGTCSLAILTGCDSHVFNFSGGWLEADLKAGTNIVQTAEIPASLQGLKVVNCYGSVHVIGSDEGAASWTWKLFIRARSDAVVQQIASEASCQAKLDDNQLKLIVSLPDIREPHSIQSDLEIGVPKSVAVQIQNQFGEVEVADLNGNVEAGDNNGQLKIWNVSGNIRAQTSFDALSVSNAGPAILKNQNGEIRVTDIGGTLEATTSFAPLVAREIRGPASLANQNGRIAATDIGGPLKAQSSFASLVAHHVEGSVQLQDQNGAIEVSQARGDADIQTSFASLSAKEIQGNAILKNQNGRVIANDIAGSVNATTSFADMEITGAGKTFICRNQNGAIRLNIASTNLESIDAKTSFDPIEIHLPADMKPAIVAQTTFADVESDFPVLTKSNNKNPFADIAPGTAKITLHNQNGKISVVRD
jgi:hypothetical protein